MSIYNKENSIGIIKNLPLSAKKDSNQYSDKIYQILKSSTDPLHTSDQPGFQIFEVPTYLLNPRYVANPLRSLVSDLRKKADILEVIIHG